MSEAEALEHTSVLGDHSVGLESPAPSGTHHEQWQGREQMHLGWSVPLY
jgi:hypothetical protein